MESNLYEVLVGNIGTVLRTDNPDEARETFELYAARSRHGWGSCAHEPVTLRKDGEPIDEEPGQGEE